MNDELRTYALRLLAQRSYTTSGLRRKLLQKEFSAGDTESALARFTECGLLDDRDFALTFARARLTATSASPRRVRQLLIQKGIPAAVAGMAVDQAVADEDIDVRRTLERLARRKLAALKDEDPRKVRGKLFAFLSRRGYNIEDVRSVLSRIVASSAEGR